MSPVTAIVCLVLATLITLDILACERLYREVRKLRDDRERLRAYDKEFWKKDP